MAYSRHIIDPYFAAKLMSASNNQAGTSSPPGSLMGRSQTAYSVPQAPDRSDASGNARPRARQKYEDLAGIEHALQLAAVTLQPDELSGRMLIKKLMPHLYTLRKKGFSFAQLTKVLNSAVGNGGKLQPATVKAYYNEFIVDRIDECKATLAATMEMIEQVKSITRTPKALVEKAVEFSTTMAATGGNSAAERLFGEQKNPRAALPGGGGGGAETTRPPPSSAESKSRPPLEVGEPPSAAGINPQMGNSGRAAAVVRAPSLLDLDDIPIPSLPADSEEAKQAAPHEVIEVGTQIEASVTAPSEGTAALIPNCLTTPAPDELLPSNSEHFEGAPQAFFSEAVLEHPGIPGLMITKAQRMFKARLRYSVGSQELIETVQQMSKRWRWKVGVPVTPSRTAKDHVPLNPGLFVSNK